MGFLDNAIRYARRRCGEISENELPSADIKDDLLISVVREFSNLFPRTGEYTLALVDGQNLYDLPGPNILEVVYFSTTSSISNNISGVVGSGYNYPLYSQGGSCGDTTIKSFSSNDIYAAAISSQSSGSVTDVSVIGDKVQVHPTPAGGSLFIITQDLWDLDEDDPEYDTIPKRLREPFQYLLAAEVAASVGNRRLKSPKIKVGDNEINLTTGAKELLKLSEQFRSRAMEVAAIDSLPFFIS